MKERTTGDVLFRIVSPAALAATLIALWWVGVASTTKPVMPTPLQVVFGFVELARKGLLLKYAVASLFRVTWGYLLAVALGIPLGLTLGWFASAFAAVNPIIQVLRPISPIAWTPIAILWFGVSDLSPIFLIFLSTFFPVVVASAAAVGQIDRVYIRSAINFGISGYDLFRKVILPASVPQILTAMRVSLGVAWLVVVAAEMIAVTSGLGFLIVDSRNAGNRYDLVVAGMVFIGLIGLVLDLLMRQLERIKEFEWGFLGG
jgi:NitT/TauT family transport system permease protein